MAIINNGRNVFAMVLSFSALLILIVPLPSFADRIVTMRQYTTLAIGCDLSNNYEFTTATKTLTYDQPTKLVFNCERSGGDVDLQKGESISPQCLHHNPLTISYAFCNISNACLGIVSKAARHI